MKDNFLKTDLIVGEISNEIFSEKVFSEEAAQSILEQIGKSASKEVQYTVQAGASQHLQKLINKLINLYKNEANELRKTYNNLSYYSTASGWSSFIYHKNDNATYEEIFQICSEILDIMRSGSYEKPLQLVVFSTDAEHNLQKVYYGDESKVNNFVMRQYKDREQLEYLLKDINLTVKNLNQKNIFAQHYNNFKKIIISSSSKTLRSLREKFEGNQINEGHIIEAFQRHLYFQHNITYMDEDVFSNATLTEKIKTKDVVINLYYAINNAGWWTGGDVGLIQNKGSNRKIASLMSIKMVASKLLELIQHYENFNIDDFKNLFTQGELNSMIKEDPEKISRQSIKKIISLIGNRTEK